MTIAFHRNRMRKITHRIEIALLIFCFLFAGLQPHARAQSDSGRVVGTVTDATGAAIPGAVLTLTNTADGSIQSDTANGNGELNISAVKPGNYTAKIEANGFQSESLALAVQVTQVQSLTFKLKPGVATTTVQVTTAASLVNTVRRDPRRNH